MNIILIGFRCTGKTTVGRYLGKRLKMEFLDSDELIELRATANIRQIFEMKGESWFRTQESKILEELAHKDNTVIATGGGCVLRYKNIRELKRRGRIVLLEADPDTLHRRIKEDPARAAARRSQPGAVRPVAASCAGLRGRGRIRVSTVSRPIGGFAEEVIEAGLKRI